MFQHSRRFETTNHDSDGFVITDAKGCRYRMVDISFVIPAFNEEVFISHTLEKIRLHASRCGSYEIIVADHGSTDKTPALAQAGGARVLHHKGGTVGDLRNAGAAAAVGEIIVFLDADVFLTDEWERYFPLTMKFLRANPAAISGSWIGLPPSPVWIEKWWFGPLVNNENSHINTGHLVVTRRYFEDLGGFDPAFETGEDYEFSQRVRRRGGQTLENPALRVEHHGFPRTLRQFIRREAWHGTADFMSLPRIINSKVAVLTCGFLLLHGAAIAAFALGDVATGMLAVGGIGALCAASSLVKYGIFKPAVTVMNSGIYYFYFIGRSLALWRSLPIRPVTRHQRLERRRSGHDGCNSRLKTRTKD